MSGQGKDRHIITLLARKITAEQLGDVTTVVADNDLNIDSIARLSGRVHLEGEDSDPDGRACVEISVRGEPRDPGAMRAAFLAIANERNLDIAFQRDSAFRRNRRLVISFFTTVGNYDYGFYWYLYLDGVSVAVIDTPVVGGYGTKQLGPSSRCACPRRRS